MQVVDHLACMWAGVYNQAVTSFADTHLFSDLASHAEQVAYQGLIFYCQVIHRGDVLIGDNQDVRGSRRVDIAENGHLFVGIELLAGSDASNDVTEDTLAHFVSFPNRIN
jgi:hypothetical protein